MGNWILWVIIGVIAVAGGIMALLNPFVATLAAEQLAGWLFLVVGLLQIIGGFREEGWGTKLWVILLGVLAVVLGVSLLSNPLAGILALTTVVAILFVVGGLTKIVLAFSLEDRSFFWMILLSGAVSLILGLMVFSNFPQSAVVLLGVLLGIDLISNGIAVIAMALALRKVKAG